MIYLLVYIKHSVVCKSKKKLEIDELSNSRELPKGILLHP